MGKTRRNHRKDDDDDDDARLVALEKKAMFGRLPMPPPGYYHDTDRDRLGRKRDRKRTQHELREVTDEYNRS